MNDVKLNSVDVLLLVTGTCSKGRSAQATILFVAKRMLRRVL